MKCSVSISMTFFNLHGSAATPPEFLLGFGVVQVMLGEGRKYSIKTY
jgi:hypothetical protein